MLLLVFKSLSGLAPSYKRTPLTPLLVLSDLQTSCCSRHPGQGLRQRVPITVKAFRYLFPIAAVVDGADFGTVTLGEDRQTRQGRFSLRLVEDVEVALTVVLVHHPRLLQQVVDDVATYRGTLQEEGGGGGGGGRRERRSEEKGVNSLRY
ncbi:hypothetical protein N1851_028295 [Merluccius polli]|uniref:Uncharacterized protein n=1 Tax=Merluccius polli TaxID=89951 RepID=A0AA47NSP2_MERPO|nr:hypothetical protein N1851_028295 [Merluccius polli]